MTDVFSSILVLSCAGSDKKEEPGKGSSTNAIGTTDTEESAEEFGVFFARKQLVEIDTLLASDVPSDVTSVCVMIKSDMPAVAKADPKLHATLSQRCGRDVSLRILERYTEKVEATFAADPTDATTRTECGRWGWYMEPVISAGAEDDPEVAKIKQRHDKVCPAAVKKILIKKAP